MGPSASDAMKRAAEAIGASGDADAAAAPAVIGPGLPPDELIENGRSRSPRSATWRSTTTDASRATARVYFKPLKGALSTADVTIGNVEGTLATGGSSKCGPNASRYCFAFRAPPKYAKALRASGLRRRQHREQPRLRLRDDGRASRR